MNQALSMGNSPAIRASRALRSINVWRMCLRAIALARRFSLTLAVIFSVVSYAGMLTGHEIFFCLTATVALCFVWLADSTKKGGEE